MAVTSEIEPVQPFDAILFASGDAVEIVLHLGGERVLDQVAEVLLEQADHRKGDPVWNQRLPARRYVAAVDDGRDDRGIGRRPPDTELFQGFHQARLCVPRRRARVVPLRLDLDRGERLALCQRRKLGFLSIIRVALFVCALLVCLQEPAKGDHSSGGDEIRDGAVDDRCGDADGCGRAFRISHLRCDRALPDQVVKLPVVAPQRALQLARDAEGLTRRTNRLVSFLGILALARIDAWLVGNGICTVQGAGLRTRGGDRLLRQVQRVCTHIGDVAVFVQALCDAHGLAGREAQLPGCFLLQRRRAERCGRATRVRFRLHRGDDYRCCWVAQCVGEGLCCLLVERTNIRPQHTLVVEVATGGDALPVDFAESGLERHPSVIRRQLGSQIPVAGSDECEAFAFTVDYQPCRSRLHSASGKPWADLAPEHRRDLVAVEAVEDATGLLGVDQCGVELTRIFLCPLNCFRRDLVKNHALDGYFRLQHLEQVPGDGLSFAILISREVKFVGVFERPLEVGNRFLLLVGDHVIRLEPVLDIDGELAERAFL